VECVLSVPVSRFPVPRHETPKKHESRPVRRLSKRLNFIGLAFSPIRHADAAATCNGGSGNSRLSCLLHLYL
jgi:hypothetical protein